MCFVWFWIALNYWYGLYTKKIRWSPENIIDQLNIETILLFDNLLGIVRIYTQQIEYICIV